MRGTEKRETTLTPGRVRLRVQLHGGTRTGRLVIGHVSIDLGDHLVVGRQDLLGSSSRGTAAGPLHPCVDERHDEDHDHQAEREPSRDLEAR